MSNDYFNASGYPATRASGASSSMRAQLAAIAAAFDKMPVLTGNGGRLVAINAGATALESVNAINGIQIGVITPAAGAFTTLSSSAAATLASLAVTAGLSVGGNVSLGDAAGDTITIAPSTVTWSNNPTHSGNHTFSGTVSASVFSGSLTGNASTATALATPRTINGVSFNGTGNITVTAAAGTLTGNTLASGVTTSSLTSVGTLLALSVANVVSATGGYLNTQSGFTSSFANDGSGLYIEAGGANGMRLRTNGSDRLTISSAGAAVLAGPVGIGRNPTHTLDVAGIGRFGTTGTGLGGNIRLVRDSGIEGWAAGILGSAGAVNYSIYDNVSGVERFRVAPGSGAPVVISAAGDFSANSYTGSASGFTFVYSADAGGPYIEAQGGADLRLITTGRVKDASGNEIGFKGLPSASVTSGAFTASDRGKRVKATGGVTIPNGVMSDGDVVYVLNTTGSPITITKSITTAYNKANGATFGTTFTLASRGSMVVEFTSGSECYIGGNIV